MLLHLQKTLIGLIAGWMVMMAAQHSQARAADSLYDRANGLLRLEFEMSLAFDCRFGVASDSTAPKSLTAGLCIFDKTTRQFHLVSESGDLMHPTIQTFSPSQIRSFGQAALHDGVFVRTPVDQIQIQTAQQTVIANLNRQEAFGLTDAMDAAGFVRQQKTTAIRPAAPPLPPSPYPHHLFVYPYPYPYPYGHFYYRRW